jgi:DNA mismatch repair protein MutS
MKQLIKQYQSIKAKYPDAIVLFRVGDYYETINEDAKIVAKHLEIIFTEATDNPGIKANTSLPFHSVDIALEKLVKAGYRVAICDQLEDPKMAKGIAKRGVTDVFK